MTSSDTIDVDFTKIGDLGNKVLERLDVVRELEPISWNTSLNGWLVCRHEDVMDAFLDKYPLSCVRMSADRAGAEAAAAFKRYPLTMQTLPTWITNQDPPHHRTLRALMMRAFSGKVVESLRPLARATISTVLDEISGRDHVEFVGDVARRITGRIILEKFGLPEDMLGRLEYWARAFNTGLGVAQPPPSALDLVEEIIGEMRGIFTVEIAKRRAAPSEDFLSQLVLAQEGDNVLSDEDILGMCYLVIIAGHETTLNTMTLGTAALCDHPAARQYLLAHPEGLIRSVMEIMRYIGMSTAFDRVATADFLWHDRQIKAGDRVWMIISSASRDPRAYPSPLTLDLSRENVERAPVFGSGIHHCIGHLLAKMQLTEFFPAFFGRFPNARVGSEPLAFQPAITFRGVDSLTVMLR